MGEALLKHAIAATDENDPVRKLEVCSAGISTVDGMLPSAHSIEALAKVGIDINSYRSTALTQKLVDQAFAIFAMDTTHIDAMKARFDNLPKRLFRVLDMAEKICDRIGIIDRGRLIMSGDLDEIRAAKGDESLEEIFLSVAGNAEAD